jgi:hypothetical protein
MSSSGIILGKGNIGNSSASPEQIRIAALEEETKKLGMAMGQTQRALQQTQLLAMSLKSLVDDLTDHIIRGIIKDHPDDIEAQKKAITSIFKNIDPESIDETINTIKESMNKKEVEE